VLQGKAKTIFGNIVKKKADCVIKAEFAVFWILLSNKSAPNGTLTELFVMMKSQYIKIMCN